ncbi:MAG: hypothetical protein M3Y18_01275 [Candidatus Eremiobacteraeota bacterium]|nr:hypothetical protein [Candidatus Eremiobacteraeota bacterium]
MYVRFVTAALAAALLTASVGPAADAIGLQVPTPAATAAPSAPPPPSAAATPTPPPIAVSPASATVAVGFDATLQVQSASGSISATSSNPAVVRAIANPLTRTVVLTGKSPGTAAVTIADQRGITATVPVRVAYGAGSVANGATVRITGDPATPDFVREQAVRAARAVAVVRPGAQLVVTAETVAYTKPLAPDNVAVVDVPVLIQSGVDLSVDGHTSVRVYNEAAPKIMPDSLLVSDYPERLESNGTLFTADLKREAPSRFLYFHFNPPGSPDRRLVLRANNASAEPALLQFVSGKGGPGPNELEVGHDSTRRFLTNEVLNQGLIVTIPPHGSENIDAQDMPANTIVSNLLQLRVLNGSSVHLTLFAQNATESPDESIATADLLSGGRAHARGIYRVPEFHYSALWRVTDQYLALTIGQLPLENMLQGEALSGDYGVKQTFVIKIQNPMPTPQQIAIYESPRGGRATGTYLIDGVLVQSHQTTAFSRYKLRQYVVPAKGFVRVAIQTFPEAGSSYPLQLIFALDDGSVAPGAPGSPIY